MQLYLHGRKALIVLSRERKYDSAPNNDFSVTLPTGLDYFPLLINNNVHNKPAFD